MKQKLRAVVQAWRTRKAINCLADQVLEFVNCESNRRKAHIRSVFLGIYEKVVKEKLWLSKNASKLQRLLMMKRYQNNYRGFTAAESYEDQPANINRVSNNKPAIETEKKKSESPKKSQVPNSASKQQKSENR